MAVNKCVCVLAAVCAAGLPAAGQDMLDDPGLAHLPPVIQQDIQTWRRKIEMARCMKLVIDTEQTWARIHELDDRGEPVVTARESLHTESWMTPELVWMVVYARGKDGIDRSHPLEQMLWDRHTSTVWERWWKADEEGYRVQRYQCESAFGPENCSMESDGCIFAGGMQSWLAGEGSLEGRCVSVQSMALLRNAKLAIVPPDPAQAGVWFDVFREGPDLSRDQDAEPESLYRRHDFMLLSRDGAGEPLVREWRTIVMTDEEGGGRSPHEIVGIRRYEYEFRDALPGPVRVAIEQFRLLADQQIESQEQDGGER